MLLLLKSVTFRRFKSLLVARKSHFIPCFFAQRRMNYVFKLIYIFALCI